MGLLPLGVAIGVSGDAQMQSGAQPSGHVPDSAGVTQTGPRSIGPCGSQHNCPAPQHSFPQHVLPAAQLEAFVVHGIGVHLPSEQNVAVSQRRPQAPQFMGSF
jgi:hypothetical protein